MPAPRSPATRILILSDGRPGHFNLSEGIAAAIERLGPAETRRIDVRRGRWPGAALAALTRLKLPPALMLRSIYGIDGTALPPAEIIVSAGAQTIAANIWLARQRAIPNIFYGSLRLFSPGDFHLVLTSYADRATRPRHAMQMKPSRLDPSTLASPSPAAAPRHPTIGLLIGGNASRDIVYTEEDWDRLARFITAMHQAERVHWLIANSPRTPPQLSDRMQTLVAGLSSPTPTFLDYRSSGPGTLPNVLAAADLMLCTADSSSMISECIWAQRPTIAITPTAFKLDRHERNYRDWLLQNRWCAEAPIATLSQQQLQKLRDSIEPSRSNPQADLAQLIRSRLNI